MLKMNNKRIIFTLINLDLVNKRDIKIIGYFYSNKIDKKIDTEIKIRLFY